MSDTDTWIMLRPLAGAEPVTSTSSTISHRWLPLCGCGRPATQSKGRRCLQCLAKELREAARAEARP